jgi:hypothetical protein
MLSARTWTRRFGGFHAIGHGNQAAGKERSTVSLRQGDGQSGSASTGKRENDLPHKTTVDIEWLTRDRLFPAMEGKVHRPVDPDVLESVSKTVRAIMQHFTAMPNG